MAYVYALCEPGSGEIRCIGQTHLQLSHRLKLYLSGAHKGRSHTSCWLRKLMREGKIPTIIELERVYGDQGFLDQAEISWIAYGRSAGLRLTNLLPGGAGYRHSRSESFKLKQRKPKSAAQIANMRRAAKARYADPVKREAHNQAMKRPATKAKLSASGKRAWAEGAFENRAPRGGATIT